MDTTSARSATKIEQMSMIVPDHTVHWGQHGYLSDVSVAGLVGTGSHVDVVRATDKTGCTQTAARAAPISDSATGWHSVQFTVQ